MAILFNKIERVSPSAPLSPKKWYPVLKTIKRVTEKDVAKEISDEVTLNRKEAEMALAQLEKVLLKNLLSSRSVQIGDWGTFYLTCYGAPADAKEGVTANNIRNLKVRFRPGKSIQQGLASAQFIATETMVSKT
jgi:predicted histone-like DNA-binding protein